VSIEKELDLSQEMQLMSFLVEAEPLAFFEIASFWLQSAYVTAESTSDSEYKYYTKAFTYLI